MKIKYTSVFESSENYERSRIPCIVCTSKNTLIGCCELRQTESDWAVIDIGMKKSYDEGVTWTERKILVSGGGENTVNNPVLIADGDTLHFLYCVNYSRVFYMKSSDEGESWSQAKELTRTLRELTGDFSWTCVATGPCHGIRLDTGRLVVPLWFAYNEQDKKSHHPSLIAVMYSDDSGGSWNMGRLFKELRDASEFSIAQIKQRLVASIRHEGENHCRAVAAVNEDCDIENMRFADNLADPVCCAGLCVGDNELLFTNCDSTEKRENLTLKRLDENFNTKEAVVICEKGGYSDIAVSSLTNTAFILREYEKLLYFTAVEL